jgi:hypothetical protein
MKYTWKINQLEIVPSQDGLSNVVQSIVWSLVASDGDVSAATEGQTQLNEPNSASFIDFENLTPNIVESWIETNTEPALLAAYRNNVAVLLQEKISVKTKNVVPPWIQ